MARWRGGRFGRWKIEAGLGLTGVGKDFRVSALEKSLAKVGGREIIGKGCAYHGAG